ncbi:hypothetical protein RQP54_18145 [Curvibacter sp. APW13]|uniref:hypothetical protein n=1 Tax=Curvibacter sp. APW13 TaxID=3077236 RepID=UPI0028DF720E|nr:hypothetical protein [Curvibacter sp. APW13]MDT8992800.1 hypothetical protein [Curvibacter sp. APW13]
MMTRDTLFRIVVPMALYAALGWWVGDKLASYPGLVAYKFFNTCGATMSILGMVVLSQLVVENPKYKAIILEHVAEQFLLLLTVGGGGLLIYAMHWTQGPSAEVVEGLGPRFYMYFVLPSMVFLNMSVNGVEHKLPWSEKTRVTAFGAYLAGGGMLLQLYAAIKDMWV